jgi:hypothetical protein
MRAGDLTMQLGFSVSRHKASRTIMLEIFSNLIEPQLYFSTLLSFASEQPTCENLVKWLAFKQKRKNIRGR